MRCVPLALRPRDTRYLSLCCLLYTDSPFLPSLGHARFSDSAAAWEPTACIKRAATGDADRNHRRPKQCAHAAVLHTTTSVRCQETYVTARCVYIERFWRRLLSRTIADWCFEAAAQPDAKQRKTLSERAVEYPEKHSNTATPAPRSMNKGVSLVSQSQTGVSQTSYHLSRTHKIPLSAWSHVSRREAQRFCLPCGRASTVTNRNTSYNPAERSSGNDSSSIFTFLAALRESIHDQDDLYTVR